VVRAELVELREDVLKKGWIGMEGLIEPTLSFFPWRQSWWTSMRTPMTERPSEVENENLKLRNLKIKK